tara:strand:+ start:441 stop:635 length:195 start_codon:yes stop_codon:yes gene_type:complete
MKVGDLVICKRAYNKKGIIVAIRKQQYYAQSICDVWIYELSDNEDKKKIFSFLESQLEVVNEDR